MKQNIENSHQYLIQPAQNWQNWRTKSLDSHPLERYALQISNKTSLKGKSLQSKHGQKEQKFGEQQLVPKITKINQQCFCILLNNSLTLFSYIEQTERALRKIRSTFQRINIDDNLLPNKIQSVQGDGSNRIYISSDYQILVLQIKDDQTLKKKVVQVYKKKFNKIKGMQFMISNLTQKLIVLTQQHVYILSMGAKFEIIKELPIKFSEESFGWKNINKISGISMIVQNFNVFYFIGTSIQLKVDVSLKLGRDSQSKQQPVQKKCQVLYITKFQIKKSQVQARVFIIDHIFQIGIFKKSRVHQVGNQTFVVSLYEQIIVIRRNFSKFMVWDNVSIVSSKSNQKKGQLILADKRIMIYTQSGQIYAHQLFFDFSKAKIQTPKIDSFKGNANEEQILYDALVFQCKAEKYMKVLFYFKQSQIYIPNRKVMSINSNRGLTQNSPKDSIFFNIMCIQQSQPTQKLKQLLQKNKSPQEVQSFLKRFKISSLKLKKSEWQVSNKGQKQIQSLLLQITDNDYIQSQLTQILKQKPHDLQFLLSIEKKQIERYRLMLACKLLKNDPNLEQAKIILKIINAPQQTSSTITQLFQMRQSDQIKLCFQWLLQSKMFQHKLVYSMNFMSFKQYDFIQIGKLRTASLREQIKLLGVKGYEKRLKYFLNSFKYLVLDDFKSILRFVIYDLTQNQMKLFFIKNFPFILPSYIQNDSQDVCKLWEDTFQQDKFHLETVNLFKNEVKTQIIKRSKSLPPTAITIPFDKSTEALDVFFDQFMRSSWFKQNQYKQHSLLRHTFQQLKDSFYQLKQVGVFNIIVQLMYQKIHQQKFSNKKVNEVIQTLKNQKFLNQDYTDNIEVRLQVYDLIVKLKNQLCKQFFGLTLPSRSQFIILKQAEYFQFIFENFRNYLLQLIKPLYEKKGQGFFISHFTKYLGSSQPKLSELTQFLDYFQQGKYEEVRLQVFNSICQMLKLSDSANSNQLVKKIVNLPILMTKNKFSLQKPINQAKVAYISLLSNLFSKFKIQYTFADLLKQSSFTSVKDTKILSQLIDKYALTYDSSVLDVIEFGCLQITGQKIGNFQLSQIIDFLAILLFIHNKANYQFSQLLIFQEIVDCLLLYNKFNDTRVFMDNLTEFGKLFDDRMLIEQQQQYKILNDFKHEYNLKTQFQNTVQKWVSCKYLQLAQYCKQKKEDEGSHKHINDNFLAIASALKILNFYSTRQQVQKQINKISLFQNLKKLNFEVLFIFITSLVQEENKYFNINSFIFMSNLLKKIKNTSIFSLHKRQDILQLLSVFNNIHRQYVAVYYDQRKRNQQIIFGQFCRFNVEFVVYLVQLKYPRMAGFVLLDLINSSFYYRDALFFYLSRIIDPIKISAKVTQKIIYQFMTIDNITDLKKILNSFIVKYQLAEVVDSKCYVTNVKSIFMQILKNNQLDQAFYYAIRSKQVEIEEFQQIAYQTNKFRNDHILSQALVVSFMRATKQRIDGQNHPTFMTFKRKITAIVRPTQRMDVIKDIFIVINQLQIQELKQKLTTHSANQNRSILAKSNSYQSLKLYYKKFMTSQNLNPWLTINVDQIQPTAIRIQKYPQYSIEEVKNQTKMIISAIRQEQTKQVKQLRKKLFDNEQRLKQIQQNNRMLLQQQIRPAISEAKAQAQREKMSLIQRKNKRKQQLELQIQKKKKQEQQPEQIQQSDEQYLVRLNNEQKQKLLQAKKNQASKIVQQTQNFIAQLRERRKKVRQETTVTFATDDDKTQRKRQEDNLSSKYKRNQKGADMMKQDLRSSYAMTSSNHNKLKSEDDNKKSLITARDQIRERIDMMRQTHIKDMRSTTINRLMSDKKGEFYVPRWQQKNPMRLQFDQLVQQKDIQKSSNFLQKVKKQLADQNEKQKQQKTKKQKNKKPVIKQIVEKYKAMKQTSIAEMIQKTSLVINNATFGAQMIKNIYNQVNDIKIFIQICKDLLQVTEQTKQFIEGKSIKVVQQALKVKAPLPFKQIFPSNLFTSVYSTAVRDYYHIAYGIIKPNLIKLMQDPTLNVNALAMAIRFGFGSDSSFYYKVFEDYIRSQLDLYQGKNQFLINDKDLIKLSQKLRVLYNNLNPSNRKIKFQQLLQQIQSSSKRLSLVKSFLRNLQSKSSLGSKQSFEQLRIILSKLQSVAEAT